MQRGRFAVAAIGVALACGAAVYLALRPAAPPASLPIQPVAAALVNPPQAVFACARCHVLPPPETLPQDRWPAMIEKMKEIIAVYRIGQDLTPDELATINAYYAGAAPASLPNLPSDGSDSSVGFTGSMIGTPPGGRADGRAPVVTNVKIVRLDSGGRVGVLVCDALEGTLSYIGRGTGAWRESTLATGLSAPAHAEVADLDGNSSPDIAVACLGGLQPTEDLVGQVVLLTNSGASFQPRVVATGLARACDVRPVDMDADGDVDLVVSTFGLYKTGGALWLERGADGNYVQHVILQSNGVTQTPVADMDGDRTPDVVALVSQEHEQVVLCANRGGGKFENTVLWRGPHPMYGCSGIELADLDKDGDQDILFTNGDALDIDTFPKPWHGVQWLENVGAPRFTYHDIGRFYGAYRPVPADLDGDGDLDVLVTSMMNKWDEAGRQSVVWYENDGSMGFSPRRLSESPTFLVTADAGDLTGDGKPDVVTGGMYVFPPYYRVGRVTLFENAGIPGPSR